MRTGRTWCWPPPRRAESAAGACRRAASPWSCTRRSPSRPCGPSTARGVPRRAVSPCSPSCCGCLPAADGHGPSPRGGCSSEGRPWPMPSWSRRSTGSSPSETPWTSSASWWSRSRCRTRGPAGTIHTSTPARSPPCRAAARSSRRPSARWPLTPSNPCALPSWRRGRARSREGRAASGNAPPRLRGLGAGAGVRAGVGSRTLPPGRGGQHRGRCSRRGSGQRARQRAGHPLLPAALLVVPR